jgi:hypothetical protein
VARALIWSDGATQGEARPPLPLALGNDDERSAPFALRCSEQQRTSEQGADDDERERLQYLKDDVQMVQ